jgi:hypothetical protein
LLVAEDVAGPPYDRGGHGELLESVLEADGLGRVERQDEPLQVSHLGGVGDVRPDVGVDVGVGDLVGVLVGAAEAV